MTLLVFVLAGILIAIIVDLRRGEKITLDGVAEIRALWLPVAGLLLHGLITWAPAFALQYAGILTSITYLSILCFLFLNREKLVPCIIMAVGSLSNYIVIAANGFRMPVSPAALQMFPTMTPEALYAKKVNYFVALHGANFYYLGDIIPVPLPKFGGFASVGDLILGIGLAAFIIAAMTKKRQTQSAAA